MPYVSADPQSAFDFSVTFGSPSGAFAAFTVPANKVSGGEITYEKAERYVGNRNFKYHARGRKSVGELTIEFGLYPIGSDANENSQSSRFKAMLDAIESDNQDKDRITCTINSITGGTTDTPNPTYDQKVFYDNCQVVGIATGDYDAQNDAVAIYTLTLQPNSKSHSAAS